MQENVPKLYSNPETGGKVTDYSVAHSTPLPEWLERYHKWGCEETKLPNFLISTYEAQMLIFLARIAGAKKVLEIGVYIGFSGMVWAHAVGKRGSVVGLELSEEYAGIARKGFEDNGVSNVEVKTGDAVESLKALAPAEPFDLIFIDANKDAYPQYLDIILSRSQPGQPGRLLKEGGLFVADNVLRRGTVADASDTNPHYVAAVEKYGEEKAATLARPLHEFNVKLVKEPRLEAFLIPLFDGLGMARLRD